MASVSSTSGISFGGLASGINSDTIIAGLTKINQQRIDTLTARQTDIATKKAAFSSLQSQLYNLQSKTTQMARSAGGAFDGRKATSSDATGLTAAAGTAAVPGTYNLTVTSLAQAGQTASAGFADPNAAIKQGTLTVRVGTGTETTVTIDSRNGTLQGLADAINTAGGDVKASVINDGTAAPYRLMLTSAKTGAANAITVTNNLTAGTGAAIDPTAVTLQAATDAQVKLGSGAGALTVSSATNQVTNLIPGVSLNLLRADSSRSLTLSVANDTDTAAKAVQDFVDAYNGVKDFIASQSKFDATTQTGGLLLGNADASALADDLSTALNTVVPGLSKSANRLSTVGLSFDATGKLALDTDKLNAALSGTGGVSATDVKRLFGLTGTSDNPGVSFMIGSDKTKPSGASPYRAVVTAPATRAVVVASGPPAASVIISPANNALLLKLNGATSSGITIPSGTYTPDQLAAVVQQQINANTALNGNKVAVGLDGSGKMQITSQSYGSGSKVSFDGGTALAALGFAGNEAATGADVIGSFLVNGATEAATGSGQVLAGAAGNANTDGLQVRTTLTAAGAADVTVNQGLASRLSGVLGKYLDPVNGRFKTISDGYQKSIDDITKTVSKQNAVLDDKKAQLQAQFAAMETAVNNLKGLQTQLSSFGVANLSGK